MYESTERVTDRRHNLNRSNYTICLGIVVANAVIFNWGADRTGQDFIVSYMAIALLSFLAIIYCIGWIRMITDFKQLNDAKFKVMKVIAERMRFETEYGEEPVSYNPFDEEWKLLDKERALTLVGKSKMLSASRFEYALPCILIFVFFITTAFTLYSLKGLVF